MIILLEYLDLLQKFLVEYNFCMQNLFYSSKAKYATYCCIRKILIVIISYNYGIITSYISIYRATADDHCRTWTRTTSRNDANGCPSPRGHAHGNDAPWGYAARRNGIPTTASTHWGRLLLGIIVSVLVYRRISHLHIITFSFKLIQELYACCVEIMQEKLVLLCTMVRLLYY